VAIARELAGWCWSLAVMPDWPTHDRPDEQRWRGGKRPGVTAIRLWAITLWRNWWRSTLDPLANSDSKVPSCGNQPAHFRLTRVDTTRSTLAATLIWSTKRRPRRRSRPPASPCPL